jgi:cytidine deaminase
MFVNTTPDTSREVQQLRFRATHLPAVREGRKRITMRYDDPVQVGPLLRSLDG